MEVAQMKITKVRKNNEGDITQVMLNDGNTLDIQQAIQMAKQGQIEDVNVGKVGDGREVLRSNRNDTTEDNLDNLPQF